MRVIAVAINHFVVEVMLIVLQFPFYVGQLSVELITLRFLCLLEYFVGAVSCHFFVLWCKNRQSKSLS